MTFGLSKMVLGIIAIVAGVLILVLPNLLGWIVAIFLIIWGTLTIMGKK